MDVSTEPAPPTAGPSWLRTFRRGAVEPLVLFLLLAALLAGVKIAQIDSFHGDSAMYFQVVDNIANRGTSLSNVFAANTYFGDQGYTGKTAEMLKKNPLSPSPIRELNPLSYHANYVFYPIAVFAKLFGPSAPLLTLYALSFVGLLYLAYTQLRARGVGLLAALLFCALVITHPAWSYGIEGQFYPERLFVCLGFLLLALAWRSDGKRTGLVITALACALVSERAAIMAGIALMLYVALYWKTGVADRYFKAAAGAALFAYGFVVFKLVVSNPEYGTFLPHSLDAALRSFAEPRFAQAAVLFAIINAFLLLVALFEWRAAAIAVVLMLPNLFGNIGGGEKTGWATHYPDTYFPVLVWAALLGYANLARWFSAAGLRPAFYILAVVFIAIFACVDPSVTNSPPYVGFSPANLQEHYVPRFVDDVDRYLGPYGRDLRRWHGELARAVPKGSTVTAFEADFPTLFEGRNVEFFPVGLDTADYAVTGITFSANGTPQFGGFLSWVSPAEAKRADAVLVARMRRDGYDFAHAVLIPQIGDAIVRRIHR